MRSERIWIAKSSNNETKETQTRRDHPIAPNTKVPIDTIMGVIFPDRLARYQQDWTHGLYKTGGMQSVSEFASMRLLCHLGGIETPDSLSGQTCRSLGIRAGFGAIELYFLPVVESYLSKLQRR